MNDLFKLINRNRGKVATGTLVLPLLLSFLLRGCDVHVHVDPVKARTNSVENPK